MYHIIQQSFRNAHFEAMAILEARQEREHDARIAYLNAVEELALTGDALAFEDMHKARAAYRHAASLMRQALDAVANAVLCNPVEKGVA